LLQNPWINSKAKSKIRKWLRICSDTVVTQLMFPF
jgi:hypothetical protein